MFVNTYIHTYVHTVKPILSTKQKANDTSCDVITAPAVANAWLTLTPNINKIRKKKNTD